MDHSRDIIGARDKCPSFVGIRKGSRRSAITVAVASSVVQGSANLFPSLMLCKGEVMF